MTGKEPAIEFLYFDDCPSWQKAAEHLEISLNRLGFAGNVQLIRVETQEEAVENKFTGSPMIRVNRDDLFPTPETNYALGCRVYHTPEGLRGWPTEEMISERLRSILDEQEESV